MEMSKTGFKMYLKRDNSKDLLKDLKLRGKKERKKELKDDLKILGLKN